MNVLRAIWRQRGAWLPGLIVLVAIFIALAVYSPQVRSFALRYTF